MQSSPRIDELRQKFHENPRRYFAPLANEYRKAGDPEQAIAICRAHLAQQPGHMSGHVVYGQSLYDAERMDEAAVVFQQALELDPENVIVLRHLGDIARQRGDVQEARSWYSRALDGDPHDAEIAAYLAELTEPLTTAPQEQQVVEAQQQPEVQVEAQAEAQPEAQPEPQAEPEPETPAERSAVEEVALEDAESEGFAADQPPATPDPEPTPPEPESDFADWPESAIEPQPTIDFSHTEESYAPDEPLISPYAREMELAAPSEMKWDLNESPYLELVESSASDDAWDSVRSDPDDSGQALHAESAGHAEELAPSMQSSHEPPPAAEPSESASVLDRDVETTQPAPLAELSEPPARKTPSRTTPVTESGPIVTRTLAELYLQQGYIEPALEIYRQLAEQEPEDRGLQARIEEIATDVESISAREEEDAAAEMVAAQESSEESIVPPVAGETADTVDAGAPVEPQSIAPESAEPESTTASAPPDELWDSADSWGDWPLTDGEDRDEIFGVPMDVAASAAEMQPATEAEPAAEATREPEHEVMAEETRAPEPEEIGETREPELEATAGATPELEPEPYAEPGPVRATITVREFFATLGSARPPHPGSEQPGAPPEPVTEASQPEPAKESGAPDAYPIADDAFGNLFAGAPSNPEDSRAAAVLSSAVAHGAPFSTGLSTPDPPPARSGQQNRESDAPAQESEEDIRRFREWLDGLSDS